MGKILDLTGQKYGRLTVIKLEYVKARSSYWLCKCDCGNEKIVRSDCLKDGNTKSCGCLVKETRVVRHGHSRPNQRHKLYNIYHGIKQRCYNKNQTVYMYYGARGIKMCDEWRKDYLNFHNWAINNGYQDGLSIERINVNGNYEPDNCTWIHPSFQNRNTRRNTRITIDGVTRLLVEWCEIYNVNMATACHRIKRGLPYDKVFEIR